VGVGVLLLRFDLLLGVAVGDGLGEAFFRFGEAVGDGVGVGFFVECFRCLRLGVGLGSGSRTFLIFEPSESSAAFATWSVPIEIAKTRSSFRRWHANVKSKAAQHCRTPKRGRDCEHTFLACVLECGGAPPLFMAHSKRLRARARVPEKIRALAPEGLPCSNEFRLRNFREENFRLANERGNLAARVPSVAFRSREFPGIRRRSGCFRLPG